MHAVTVGPLTRVPRLLLAEWTREFEQVMRARVPSDTLELVRHHLQAGDVCAVVTATTRLIAEPCARAFGMVNVVATEAQTEDGTPEGALTGEIAGLPCFREHKLTRVRQWLAQQQPSGAGELGAFEQSWFYSDSVSDLPLLQAVSHPVAVRPDERLRQHAMQAGWPVFDPT